MRVPNAWQTSFVVQERTLIISFAKPRLTISSAVLGGGMRKTRVIINHQVDEEASFKAQAPDRARIHADPQRYLARVITRLTGMRGGIGLMTAVDLRQLVLKRVQSGPLWIEGFFTVGITNAVRVGEPVDDRLSSKHTNALGTINMILITNASLPPSALVGAIGVATESKTAVMLERSIKSWTGRQGATGTGTDSVVFVSGSGPRLRFSGTHTKLGELIGRVVRAGVERGLQRIRR